MPGLTVPVARTGALSLSSCWPATTIRGRRISPISGAGLIKKVTGLRAVATPAELDLARDAVELIVERGFHRDRALAAALARLLES